MARNGPSLIFHESGGKKLMVRRNYIIDSLSYKFAIFFIALSYACLLTTQPIDLFVDRNNYLTYAINSREIYDRYLAQGWLSVFFNEPLWLGVNVLIGSALSPENALRLIIFFSSFVTAYLVLIYQARWFILLLMFLFLPQVIKNNIIHLRQGLAIAVFLCGWFSHNRIFRYLFYGAACFIHSSFLIIVFLIMLDDISIKCRMSSEIRAILVLAVGLLVGVGGLWIADLVNARQADQYISGAVAVSGLGFVFWMAVATIFMLQGRSFLRDNSLQFSIIIFYLSTYFFLAVAARVFESALLLVFFSALQLTNYRKYAFIFLFVCYFFIQWSARIMLPSFGWGVQNYL
ncbi:MAG TPA: EpsG family protein [Edaphocola sp.]|nr:EpsG family protein [Edaphocola sp.]